MNIFGLIVFIIFIVLFTALVIDDVRLRNLKRKLVNDLIQNEIDLGVLYNKLSEVILEKEAKEVEKTDGFLKFISDSRDWAYQYIEMVQKALNDFQNVVGPELKYFNTYGRAVDSPHAGMLEKIVTAYEELSKVMPEESEEKK